MGESSAFDFIALDPLPHETMTADMSEERLLLVIAVVVVLLGDVAISGLGSSTCDISRHALCDPRSTSQASKCIDEDIALRWKLGAKHCIARSRPYLMVPYMATRFAAASFGILGPAGPGTERLADSEHIKEESCERSALYFALLGRGRRALRCVGVGGGGRFKQLVGAGSKHQCDMSVRWPPCQLLFGLLAYARIL